MSSNTVKIYHIIYPHQLFEEVLDFDKDTNFLIVEDPLFFNDKKYPRKFHKQKLILHRASMKSFSDKLKEQGYKVTYFEYTEYPDPILIAKFLSDKKAEEVTVFDPTDYILGKRIKKYFTEENLNFHILESPNFLTSVSILKGYFGDKKKYLMNNFYIFQRKRLNILIDSTGLPEGGDWNYDKENRKKLPRGIQIPPKLTFKKNKYVTEAIEYVNKYFKDNPGSAENFNYPVTHEDATELLVDFLQNKLEFFGAYEDAISKNETVLFHSMLSAPLNIGLLSPKEIVSKTLTFKNKVPITSLEGFLRQIIGWREFMRAVYLFKGTEIRNRNFLNHKEKLPVSWYRGDTGVEPIDITIKKLLDSAYCHHIERLMILGNFMLLLQIDPNEVYGWFMDMFIDSYDWVMVPNVYAMSQYADGGTITTKPYFSSSNYVLKMSDYKKGDWCQIWNNLFYKFLETHNKVLANNPRMKLMLSNINKLK